MRVIKNCDEYEFTCHKCKSVLGLVAEDLTDVEFVGLVATCPVCDVQMHIETKHIPKSWRSKIKWCDE